MATECDPPLKPLVDAVRARPEAFATGDESIRELALHATKFLFDQAVAYEKVAEPHINFLLKALVQTPEAGPTTRSQTKKSEDSTPAQPTSLPPFVSSPLETLHLDGMNADQVWEQLELRTKNILKVLEAVVVPDAPPDDEVSGESEEDSEEVSDEDGMDLDMDNIDMYNDMDSEEDDEDEDEDLDEEEANAFSFRDGDDLGEEEEDEDDYIEGGSVIDQESFTKLRPGRDEVGHPELDLDRPRGGGSLNASKRPAHPVLDDGFFSIDEFNRETEELESLSRSKGGLNDDDEDEDGAEDVDLFKPIEDEPDAFEEDDAEDTSSSYLMYKDFFTPPSRLPSASKSKPPKKLSQRARAANEIDPPSSDSIPTPKSGSSKGVKFNDEVRVKTIEARKNTPSERLALYKRMGMGRGAMGIQFEREPGEIVDDDNEEWEDEEDEDEDEDDDGEEDVDWDMEKFDDVDGEGSGWPGEDDDEEEDDMDLDEEEGSEEGDDGADQVGVETIQRLKNDLFDDEESESGGQDLSAHARRQAALAEEIASFEAENVAKKDWALMGEATARVRPKNSLLEENLDFERSGGARAAPAVTEETTKTLEDLIKARILEARYDDVVRRRPIEEERPFMPSRLIELDDKKSSRSLAQIYEDEYSSARATASGETAIDDRDGKLAKEHEELEKMWSAICYKLDALSNAHFTPKQPSAAISTISNVSSTTLESALPTVASTSTLLAPEELLAPKTAASIRDRSELTPQEKQASRMKARKRRKKQSEVVQQFTASRDRKTDGLKSSASGKGRGSLSATRKEKDDALRTLVKSGKGVTVIGKDAKRFGANANGKGSKGKGATEASPAEGATRWKL